MIVFTPPAHLPVWSLLGLMSLEKLNPRLQTMFSSVNWCLSLAVCFWGLRRVKYAWLQHGWLKFFLKNNKQMTWNLYLAEANRILNWFLFWGRTPREPQQLTRFVCFFWKGATVIFTERTHTKQVRNLTHTHTLTCVHTHICFHLPLAEEETNLKIATETHLSNLFIKLPNAPLNECN